MKKVVSILSVFLVIAVASATQAGGIEGFLKRIVGIPAGTSQSEPDGERVVAGLKEALTLGAENAVRLLSQRDGYFSNELVKILFPDRIQRVADMLGRAGFQEQVDEFILSMNRAAEAAAPQAREIFLDAIQSMTFDDAMAILRGDETSATDYFREKTSERLYEEFKPVIVATMNRVGVTRAYRDMMAPYETLPLVPLESMDLDHYVATKALDGLFLMIGEEEKKIRSDPAARVTELLKTLFGQ